MKDKVLFFVYAKEVVYQGDDNIFGDDDWWLVGTTYATSEKQAINNVRHRLYGDSYSSQYKAVYVDKFSFEAKHRMWKAVTEKIGD